MTALPRGYIELQLRFAAAMTRLGNGDSASTVLGCTNLHRRFGFGPPGADPHPDWNVFVNGLAALATIDDQVDYSVDFLGRLDPGHAFQHTGPRFGPFSVAVVDGAIRTHFVPEPSRAASPLDPSRLGELRSELRDALSYARRAFPDADRVRGISWLYSTTSYRSLFPARHVDTAVIRTGMTRFQGSSSWGQFLDHSGGVKADLGERFVVGLDTLDPTSPWRSFPIPTLVVDSPVEVFDAWLAGF